MIVYNTRWLRNLYIRQQADEALHEAAIDAEGHQALYAHAPVGFYTPNIFIRIGLGFAVFIVMVFSLGLLALMFSATLNRSEEYQGFAAFLCFVGGIGGLLAALYYIRSRHDYNSGRDNMLVWLSAVFFYFAITLTFMPHDPWPATSSLLAFIIAATYALVFVDELMSILAFLSLVLFIHFSAAQFSATGQVTGTFFIIGVSWAVYYVLTGMERLYPLYRNCIYYLRLAALLCMYAAGNYFMVGMAATGFETHAFFTIPGALGIFYWVWTLALPFVYIYVGVRRRQLMLIRVGTLLVVAGILTFRRYHSVMPAEVALILGGLIAISVAAFFLRSLRQTRNGFTALRGFSGYDKHLVEQVLEDKITKPHGDRPDAQENTW